ncbi:AMP-binding protein [Nitrincola alkalilacustris]|uniref:AMP-binding protein n=1 Tax=Nitrincola alkalilacustris TaxID=1571224 RepID=UPI00124D398D|nr:AMP-binding protein [Nitrincola alkalilacustris]
MWWRDRKQLRRFTLDLVMHRLTIQRPGITLPSPANALLAQRWRDAPLNLDSLELVESATLFAQALHITETGLEDLLLAQPSLNGWVDIACDSLEQYHDHISFFSSGSTGEPARHKQPLTHLLREASFLRECLQRQTAPDQQARVWSLVPAHHIYGFIFTVLLPDLLGPDTEVIDARTRLLTSIERNLKPGDILVAVPEFWQRWVSTGMRLPPGCKAVTAAGPSNSDTLRQLINQGAELLEIYGSSETAGLGYRRSPESPLTLMPHWTIEGDTAVSDCLRADLPDRLEWSDARHFVVAGRKDKAVQIAGVNVYPDRIAGLISTHEAVAEAAVRLQGQRLKAFVVPEKDLPDSDFASLEHSLRRWLSTQLPAGQIPGHFAFGDSLPRNSMNKLSDWLIE